MRSCLPIYFAAGIVRSKLISAYKAHSCHTLLPLPRCYLLRPYVHARVLLMPALDLRFDQCNLRMGLSELLRVSSHVCLAAKSSKAIEERGRFRFL